MFRKKMRVCSQLPLPSQKSPHLLISLRTFHERGPLHIDRKQLLPARDPRQAFPHSLRRKSRQRWCPTFTRSRKQSVKCICKPFNIKCAFWNNPAHLFFFHHMKYSSLKHYLNVKRIYVSPQSVNHQQTRLTGSRQHIMSPSVYLMVYSFVTMIKCLNYQHWAFCSELLM